MRVIDFFDRGAGLYPDRIAFRDDRRRLTYREAQALTHRIARGLIAGGIAPGEVVAIYSPNDIDAFLCILGALRAGAAYVALNALALIDDNLYVLDHRDARWLFLHSAFAEHLPRIRAAAPKLAGLVAIDRAIDDLPMLGDWIADRRPPAPDIDRAPDDLACLFATGGTTGRSKAAMLTHRVFEAMIASANAAMPYDAPPVHLLAAPMTHGAGLAAFWLFPLGATNVVLPRAEPLAVMAAIEQHKVTTLFLPPTAVYVMLAHPRLRAFDYSSLKYFIYAAAPMSVEKLKEALAAFGPVMTQIYGQAEAPMMCTYLAPREHLTAGDSAGERRLASCGRPSLLTPVEIMDDDGCLLAPDERGEIVVRGNLVMKGYYKDPQATAEAGLHGWHHTGDIGVKDGEGYVYILDRKKDMIISGGFNIYPGEIEQAIWALPAVQDCAVIGVPDDKWGEAVKAVIELKPGMTITEPEVIAHCKARLGSVKAPKSVEFWDELPRSPVGKVLKRAVRERYWKGRKRNI